jgi:histidine ammonia-lyase
LPVISGGVVNASDDRAAVWQAGAPVELRPGRTRLADWRAIYRGAPVAIDSVARADVEAGAAALAAILANGDSATDTKREAPATPAAPPAEASEAGERVENGETLPLAVTRLAVALKLASLARGMSGVRWALLERLTERLSFGQIPQVPAGGVGEREALARLAVGLFGEDARPQSLQASNAPPCPQPTPWEKDALCSGGQISTALALAGVFEAERVLQSALVATALSHDAMRGSADGVKARLPRRHAAGNDVAATLGALLARAQLRPVRAGGSSAEPPSSLDAQVELVGACLDLLRAAGETLVEEANTVADDALVVWQTGELVACGPSSGAPVAVAADLVALALGHLAGLSERRIGMLLDPALPRRMRISARPSGLAALYATAATLAAETRERARPASFESSEGTRSPAIPGARRLLPMAGNVTLILAVELMAATEAFELGGRKRSSDALEPVRALIRARAPRPGKDGLLAPDLAAVAELIRSGALARAANVALPYLVG